MQEIYVSTLNFICANQPITLKELILFFEKAQVDKKSQTELLNQLLSSPIISYRDDFIFMLPQI